MDVVRTCPPHRLIDLQDVAKSLLGLPRLAALCALQRYQRKIREGFYSLEEEDPSNVTRYSQIPPSTFATDLLCLLKSGSHSDVILAAADYNQQPSVSTSTSQELRIPSGHTAFSWFAQDKLDDDDKCYPGHTPFSMGSGADASSSPLTIRAHMFILMRYPFFRVLLNGHFKEEETVKAGGTLRLDTVPDGPSLQGMLEWIYSGTVQGGVDGDNVADLLRSSQAFGVDDLARHCELFLLEGLTKDNAFDVVTLAHENGLTKLVKECEYAMQNGNGQAMEEEEE
jgi:hypothetical protein